MCLFRHTLAEIVVGMPSYSVHCHHANLGRRSRLARIHHLLRQRSFPTKGTAADPKILPSETLAIPNDMLIQLNDNIRNIFYSKVLAAAIAMLTMLQFPTAQSHGCKLSIPFRASRFGASPAL